MQQSKINVTVAAWLPDRNVLHSTNGWGVTPTQGTSFLPKALVMGESCHLQRGVIYGSDMHLCILVR